MRGHRHRQGRDARLHRHGPAGRIEQHPLPARDPNEPHRGHGRRRRWIRGPVRDRLRKRPTASNGDANRQRRRRPVRRTGRGRRQRRRQRHRGPVAAGLHRVVRQRRRRSGRQQGHGRRQRRMVGLMRPERMDGRPELEPEHALLRRGSQLLLGTARRNSQQLPRQHRRLPTGRYRVDRHRRRWCREQRRHRRRRSDLRKRRGPR